MEKEESKPWERPWTTDEIREHSANWTLAGDSGLLNHLQQFSQNLLTRTHATGVALDELVEDLKTASTDVENATNTFLSLANTQFVENRVYDDDEKETPPEDRKDDIKIQKSKEEQEAEVFQNIKQALDISLALLDTHFEAVDVPASDSEEDESSASVGRLVLKPKYPYSSRPLPYLIGSREFMEDDKVGLGEIFSDLEEGPEQNIVQSSESDEEIDNDQFKASAKRPGALSSSESENSEPESYRSEVITKTKKLKSKSSLSILGEGEREENDLFGRTSSPEADDVPSSKGSLKNSFSDELASKLKMAKTSLQEGEEDNLFAPSIKSLEEEDDDSLFGKVNHPFTEKSNLFEDLDDWKPDSLLKTNTLSTEKSSSRPATDRKSAISNVPENEKVQNEESRTASNQRFNVPNNVAQEGKMSASTPEVIPTLKTKEIFFGSGDEEDDLFSQNFKDSGSIAGKSSLLGKNFGESDEEDLFAIPASSISPAPSQNSQKKKLPGAVRVFGDVNPFGNISPIGRQISEIENASAENAISGRTSQESSSGIGRSNVILKDEESESQSKLVSANGISHITFESQNIFTSTKITDVGSTKPSLYNTEIDSDSLFGRPKLQEQNINSNSSVFKTSAAASSSPATKAKKPLSLFDDSDSGDDSFLFSSASSTSSRSRRSQGSGDVLGGGTEKRTLPRKDLFKDSSLFDDMNKNEPEVDIFKSQTERESGNSIRNSGFIDKEPRSENITSEKKVVSSIFDDIDEVDDIFAVSKITVDKIATEIESKPVLTSEKVSLFSDNVDEKNDIFSDIVDDIKKSENLMTQLDISHHTDESPDVMPSDQVMSVAASNPTFVSSENRMDSEPQKSNNVPKRPTLNQKPKVFVEPSVSFLDEDSSESVSQMNNRVEKDERVPGDDEIIDTVANELFQQSVEASTVENKSEGDAPAVQGKPEPPRTLNIRKTTEIVFGSPSNEDDDLFESTLSSKSTVEDTFFQNEQLPKNTISSSNFSKILEGFNSVSSEKLPGASVFVDSPPENTSNKSDARGPLKSISSPSKIHIDPRALLPGAKPPKKMVTSEDAIGFDQPAETATLHSAGKERVKIPVKRRPQTRKARQEALKAASNDYDNLDAALTSQVAINDGSIQKNNANSSDVLPRCPNSTPAIVHTESAVCSTLKQNFNNVLEEGLNENSIDHLSTSESEQLPHKTDLVKNVLSDGLSSNSNALSPLTDEEDLFAVPQELPCDETNNKPHDENNLFGGGPVLSPIEVKNSSETFDSQLSSKMENEESLLSNLGMKMEKTDENADAGISSSTSASTSDISTLPTVVRVDDIFEKDPVSKGPDQEDTSLSSDSRGLFDEDYSNGEMISDEDSDDGVDDIFRIVPKGTGVLRVDEEVLPNVDGHKDTFRGCKHYRALLDPSKMPRSVTVKSTFSDDLRFSPVQDPLPVKDVYDIRIYPTTPDNTSSTQEGGNTALFSKDNNELFKKKDDDFFSTVSRDPTKTKNSSSSDKISEQNSNQEKSNTSTRSLFGDGTVESDDLFGSSLRNKSTSSSSYRAGLKLKDVNKSLFDDTGDDDDIFAVSLNKKNVPKGEELFSKTEENPEKSKKENDDLFSKASSNGPKQSSKSPPGEKVQFEDPLMGFGK